MHQEDHQQQLRLAELGETTVLDKDGKPAKLNTRVFQPPPAHADAGAVVTASMTAATAATFRRVCIVRNLCRPVLGLGPYWAAPSGLTDT